ncbi:uncharacterized protein TRIADDRAFT_53751 [Trichoplax adhaerens]|uniref:TMC domain-containing protein n=1 Tax=Trichoplax adhaerens TaxID=10228 RepID=B3RQ25_TRIAD|nr:hypothetical protein TRIADDRAFT_53751 [Trichoplax adhaerens]EDV27746.1 hypothetical protein TRIADDRAFT_53751 [Trichoplax adhaerens]|eukprot:XP_002109580.1 hypothetical protein TRIADDRAFT_53751 [Trichoplax adhaerens]
MSSSVHPRRSGKRQKSTESHQEMIDIETPRSSVPGSVTHDDDILLSKPTSRHTNLHTGHQSSIMARMPSQQAIQSAPGANLTRKDCHRRWVRSSRSGFQSIPNDEREDQIEDVEDEDYSHEHHEHRAKLIKQYASNMKRKREEYQKLQKATALKYGNQGHRDRKQKGIWQSVKQGFHENFSFSLWRSHLKEVEGQFGNGVLSYFIFLRWLFYLNLMLGLMWFGFLCVPEILLAHRNVVSFDYATFNISQSIANTTTGASIYCSPDYIANTTSTTHLFIVIISGKGQMECSQLFYGNYTADVVHTPNIPIYYSMPFVYFVVTLVHFILSLVLVARSASNAYQKSYIEGGSSVHQFCNKLFGGWDYCICEQKAAELKMKSIAHDMKVDLAEEIRAIESKLRNKKEKCTIYLKRILVNLIILGILSAAGAAIYYAAKETIDSQTTSASSAFLQLLRNYTASLTISGLNIILPPIFSILILYENYSPNFEVQLTLLRTVFLKLASIIFLLASLFTVTRNAASGGSDTILCWETYVGQELFKLVVVNFFVVVFATILVEFPQRFIADRIRSQTICCIPIYPPEFQIPKNVLDLVYAQVLCWLGAFYCPMVPLMIVVSLVVIFYVKKISLVYNNHPSQRPYRTSKSNSFFMLLLIISYFLAAIPVGYGWANLTPSKQCGPYRSQSTVIDAITIIVKKNLPTIAWDILSFIFSAGFIIPLILIMRIITAFVAFTLQLPPIDIIITILAVTIANY